MKTRKNLAAALIVLLLTGVQLAKAQGDQGEWVTPVLGASEPCIPTATTWFLGGNIIPVPNPQGPVVVTCNTCPPPPPQVIPVFDVGTCNNFPFVLKANNFKSVFILPSGNIGINNPNPITALDIKNANPANQSNFRIFGDQNGNVESTTDMRLHYNTGKRFEINQGTSGSPITRFSIDPSGIASVDNILEVGPAIWPGIGARVVVDGQNSHGLMILGDNGNNGTGNLALGVANNQGAHRIRMWINAGGGDDTKIHLAGNTQIGFHQSSGDLLDNTVKLNVDGTTDDGIKVTTNNPTRKMFIVDYNANRTFEVNGDGTTNIGSGRPLSTGIAATAKLSVDGMILAKDIRVAISTATHWADYVFEKDYKLMDLKEIEKFITKNKHLPEVPSESEVIREGMDVTNMSVVLLKKIEELYLYTIDLKKQNDKLEKQIEKLSDGVKAVSK
jgi:hypothetical protein